MSLASQTHALATSAGVPPLLRGIEFLQFSIIFSSNFLVISVSIKPGAITLQRIFLEPNSNAIDYENPIIPALEAE